MKRTLLIFAIIVLATAGLFTASAHYNRKYLAAHAPVPTVIQTSAATANARERNIQEAMWTVAKVFGRDSGCKDADPTLGRLVAEAAIDEGVAPELVASTIGTESKCNPYAVSIRGAIGLMQIMPTVHKGTYDFQNKVNLLNPRDNIRTGTHILATYVKTYGRQEGVVHYQGLGTACATCDDGYARKVFALADGK